MLTIGFAVVRPILISAFVLAGAADSVVEAHKQCIEANATQGSFSRADDTSSSLSLFLGSSSKPGQSWHTLGLKNSCLHDDVLACYAF